MSYGQSKIGEPWRGYYITAYGIAVKHGFLGTEEEWLASLKGEKGDPLQVRYNEDLEKLQWKYEGEEEWQELMSLAELQGDVVSRTLEAATAAKEGAEAAKTGAETAKGAAEIARDEAVAAKTAAETAQSGAAGAEVRAASAASSAKQSAEDAEAAQSGAEAAKEGIEAAEANAAASANRAKESEEHAKAYEASAKVSADTALAATGNTRTCRVVVGTSTAGWTEADCDYLCDGVDDHEEIQAAINALPATAGGKQIVILSGVYYLNESITINRGSTMLTGSGERPTLYQNKTNISTFIMKASDCGIENLKIYNRNGHTAAGMFYGCIQIETSNCLIRNNRIANQECGVWTRAMQINGHNTISNNYFSNISYGIVIESECDIVSENIIENSIQGIELRANGRGFITNNRIKGNKSTSEVGIALYDTYNNIVALNACFTNNIGILMSTKYPSYAETQGANQNIILGNDIWRGLGYSDSQYSIKLNANKNDKNFIVNNKILGKNYVDESINGNNKFIENWFE